MNPKLYKAKLIKKEQVARDAHSFYFTRPPDFEFLPGQYIQMAIQIAQPDERGARRFFSLVNSPTITDHLTITTRIIQSSFKKTLLGMPIGAGVQILGPMGNFVLKEEETMPHVFLAGGIGITPFHSMLEYSVEKNLSIPVTLFSSFATVEDIVYHDELKQFSQKNPHIKIVETITKPESSTKSWNGNTGRINEDLTTKNVPDILNALFFVCGPPGMVVGLTKLLEDMGVAKEKIRAEKFTGY